LPKLKNRFAEVKHGISNLHWENDYMNFDEARHISDNFRSKANKEYKFTINSYGLDNFIQLGMTIDEALEYREEPSTPHYANLQKIMDERINDYKHKKLSI